ncbi:MAG: RagB/SusD family nutrient uptake outer membrane protein, partial [Paramuribaculum sp.]|nr:RagB/SusD family nutrient uptake outer membrane protein [Paramuribaculum sp.]
MKLKYIATAALACVGLLQSCSYTDLDPLEGFTDQTYWKTATDLELYCNYLLTALPGASSTGDSESDDMVTQSQSSYLFNYMTVNNASGWDWSYIRNCNYFMTHYNTAECSEDVKNRYVAEVRFMRSLDYFDKIKRFGDVPWYDEDLQTNSYEQLYKPRDPRNYVLNKIIEDLQFAITWLPEKSWGTFGERPHKDAARQQLARV